MFISLKLCSMFLQNILLILFIILNNITTIAFSCRQLSFKTNSFNEFAHICVEQFVSKFRTMPEKEIASGSVIDTLSECVLHSSYFYSTERRNNRCDVPSFFYRTDNFMCITELCKIYMDLKERTLTHQRCPFKHYNISVIKWCYLHSVGTIKFHFTFPNITKKFMIFLQMHSTNKLCSTYIIISLRIFIVKNPLVVLLFQSIFKNKYGLEKNIRIYICIQLILN